MPNKKNIKILLKFTLIFSLLLISVVTQSSIDSNNCENTLLEKQLRISLREKDSSSDWAESKQSILESKNTNLSFLEKMSKFQPYGPRGFVMGNDAKTPLEIADSLDAGFL